MSYILFENSHNSATAEFPYIDISGTNVSYVSHFHDEVEIVAVKEGELLAVTESSKFTIKSGETCVFMPGEIHNLISETGNRETLMKISVPKNIISEFSAVRLCDNIIRRGMKENDDIRGIIEKIVDECISQKPGYTLAVQAMSLEILLYILRNLKSEKVCFDVNKRSQRHAKLLGDVNGYLEKNYKDNITLEDAAEKIGYSKYYFSHYFKTITNMNFIEYTTLYRLQKAAALIRDSGEKIIDIAYSCGFNNIRSFNRMFKKFYQLTPTEYRSIYNKEK